MSRIFILDCESLGVADNSIVLSIGMTYFDEGESPTFDDLLERGYYTKCERKEQKAAGRIAEADTLAWWEDQGSEAREVLSNKDVLPFKRWSREFKEWLEDHECDDHSTIMSRGLIDERFVNTCFLSFNKPRIFNYWQFRDTRTALDLLCGTSEGPRCDLDGFIKHNALHDAAADALRLCIAFKKANGEEYEPDKVPF